MVGAIGNVVHAEHDLARQLPLESQIPLVNVGVSRRGRAQVVIVGIPPIRQCAILRALRTGKAGGKRIFQGCGLVPEIVVCKEHRGGLGESGSGILEIGGRAHSEIYARSAAQDRLRIESIGKAQPRSTTPYKL
jgi:hypothetical protein